MSKLSQPATRQKLFFPKFIPRKETNDNMLTIHPCWLFEANFDHQVKAVFIIEIRQLDCEAGDQVGAPEKRWAQRRKTHARLSPIYSSSASDPGYI